MTAFDVLDQALKAEGPAAALGRLIGLLEERDEPRALLDALLLKARHELGLPLIQAGSLGELVEPVRTQYEDRYIEAIRTVGQRLLDRGDIPSAWPYFRAIGEKERVAAAIEAFEPADGDTQVSAVVEVAFNQGAHPRKGFALILDHFGACSAITAFEHLPPDDAHRVPSADRLVRHIHAHLTASLRAEIGRRGKPLPPEGTSITALIAGRDWLFMDDAYHLDVSHLAATVRISPMLTDPATIRLAAELTDYGRRLSSMHRYECEPPFDRLYEDHAVYLRALLGQEVDDAIAHFLSKIPPREPGAPLHPADSLPAQILVQLLVRLDRIGQAIDVASEHLADLPESSLICPSVSQLCQRAGLPDRLAQVARDNGDLVNYTAAILEPKGPASP
jgi:hypothetical protein